jgi:hypothetical protein
MQRHCRKVGSTIALAMIVCLGTTTTPFGGVCGAASDGVGNPIPNSSPGRDTAERQGSGTGTDVMGHPSNAPGAATGGTDTRGGTRTGTGTSGSRAGATGGTGASGGTAAAGTGATSGTGGGMGSGGGAAGGGAAGGH